MSEMPTPDYESDAREMAQAVSEEARVHYICPSPEYGALVVFKDTNRSKILLSDYFTTLEAIELAKQSGVTRDFYFSVGGNVNAEIIWDNAFFDELGKLGVRGSVQELGGVL